MRSFRRLILVNSLLIMLICLLLLANITAPNPTGRRYSSAQPLLTGQASGNLIGNSGEAVLGTDLRVPNNNQSNERQCICGSRQRNQPRTPNGCNVCIAYIPTLSDHRIPDFVTTGYIAEAKNVQRLFIRHHDYFNQIRDYADAARQLGIPLWLYTRMDTVVDVEFVDMVEATGGAMVPYFVVPGYVDPIDDAARRVGGVALILFLLMLGWEIASRRRKASVTVPARPDTPRPTRGGDPLGKAARSVKDAGEWSSSSRDRVRTRIDIEDSHHDTP